MITLAWGLKSSLLAYVRSQPDGSVTPSEDAWERDGVFVFPGAVVGDELHFRGCVTVRAHDGLMNVPLADVRITPAGDRWELSIRDPEDPSRRMRFATVGALETVRGRGMRGTEVAMALPGSDLFFFGPYGPGTALDDFVVSEGDVL